MQDIRLVGGILEPSTYMTLDGLWQQDPNLPYVDNGDAPLILDGVQSGPRLPALTSDRTTLTSPKHANRKWGLIHDPAANELHFGYTHSTETNFDYANSAAKLTNAGMFQAKGYAGVKVQIANDAIGKYAVTAVHSSNKRGFFTVHADAPGQPFVYCYHNGTTFTPIVVGSSAQVENSDVSVAGKMIVFPDVNGHIAIRNMLGSTRNFMIEFHG
ncbi:hypothetical protein D3C76_1196970 [compost metagenome]